MRRAFTPLFVLLFLLLVGTMGLLWQTEEPVDENLPKVAFPKHSPSDPQRLVREGNVQGEKSQTQTTRGPTFTADPAHYKRAYMLSLDGNRLSMESVQDIEGDFAARRRQPEEWSGMLRCRLTDADGQTLAEEIIAAPDQLCTVLDSHDGPPKPVKLAIPGPVIFQVRLPRVADAHQLEVFRIRGSGNLTHDQRLGNLSLNE